MSDAATVIPPWVSVVSPFLVTAASALAYVFGKGSTSGKQALELRTVVADVEGIKKTLNDTVIAVSNHTQSIENVTARINSIDSELKHANNGIATLLERTKRI